MKDYGAQNNNRKRKIISELTDSVKDILSNHVYNGDIDYDNILYAGLVRSRGSFYWPKVAAMLLFHFLIVQRFILSISTSPSSYNQASIFSIFQTLALMFALYIEINYIFQLYKRYYLFIMDDEIAIIPLDKPLMYIRMPMEYLKEINIHLSYKISRSFSISVSDDLMELYPTDDKRFDTLSKEFFVGLYMYKKTSGSLFNIQYAMMSSQYKDKLRFNGKRCSPSK